MTQDEKTLNFIKKAKEIHSDKYIYEKTVFVRSDKKLCITCPVHGDFMMTPYYHLHGMGCKKCGIRQRVTTEDFVSKAIEKYGNKYDYSRVKYVNSNTPVEIVCPTHGLFTQKPSYHMIWCGCKECSKENKKDTKHVTKTTEEFINDAKLIHGETYDYSKVDYKNRTEKVCIICKKHGEFYQSPGHHLTGQGCPICGAQRTFEKQRYTTESFIKRAKAVHGDKYDYSKTEYVDSRTHVCITCKTHGDFFQIPAAHLSGEGCRKCSTEKVHKEQRSNTEEFLEKAKKSHWNHNYDFSLVDYFNNEKKITVICHEKFKNGDEHGPFLISPANLLKGKGCPKCRYSLLEQEVGAILKNENVEFEGQKTFEWLNGNKGPRSKYRLDYYLPKYGAAIECQGIQHYVPVNFGTSSYTPAEDCDDVAIKDFENSQYRDKRKRELCEKYGVKLYYVKFDDPIKERVLNILDDLKENSIV